MDGLIGISRNSQIAEEYCCEPVSLGDLGLRYGISRQMVHKICISRGVGGMGFLRRLTAVRSARRSLRLSSLLWGIKFWSRVDRGSGCWPWTGSTTPPSGNSVSGYGTTMRRYKSLYTHRVAWEMSRGRPVPVGKVVMHKCDNPVCCNPSHLKMGTHADNMADRDSKGRGVGGPNRPGLVK